MVCVQAKQCGQEVFLIGQPVTIKSEHALILWMTRMKQGVVRSNFWDVFVQFLRCIDEISMMNLCNFYDVFVRCLCCICIICAGYIRLQPEYWVVYMFNARPKPCKVYGWCIYTGSSAAWYSHTLSTHLLAQFKHGAEFFDPHCFTVFGAWKTNPE